MYSNVVLRLFDNPLNAGRISKPDGIADLYNENETAHVEFSLRIESGIITDCKFRAQANPYIIAICSTITTMVKGKILAMAFLDPYSIKEQLGDHADIDIMFCIDCFKMAIDDYKEKISKTIKKTEKAEKEIVEDVPVEKSLEDDIYGDEEVEILEETITEKIEEPKSTTNLDFDFFDDDDFGEDF